ncbi:hypothetical protein OSTOST_15838, partial [Ostertagia ostertagi]
MKEKIIVWEKGFRGERAPERSSRGELAHKDTHREKGSPGISQSSNLDQLKSEHCGRGLNGDSSHLTKHFEATINVVGLSKTYGTSIFKKLFDCQFGKLSEKKAVDDLNLKMYHGQITKKESLTKETWSRKSTTLSVADSPKTNRIVPTVQYPFQFVDSHGAPGVLLQAEGRACLTKCELSMWRIRERMNSRDLGKPTDANYANFIVYKAREYFRAKRSHRLIYDGIKN